MEEKDDKALNKEFLSEYNKITNGLRAYIRQLVPTRDDAEEVLQNTSIVLWNKFEKFESGTSFFSWACRVAHFEVLSYRRDKARDRHVFSDALFEILADEVDEIVESHDERTRALKRCFTQLKQKYQNMIVDVYFKKEKINAVAELMNTTPSALYKVLSRVRTKLRHCIEQSQ